MTPYTRLGGWGIRGIGIFLKRFAGETGEPPEGDGVLHGWLAGAWAPR